ncbi:hypothetical protein OVA24_16195 [Luteolibacter sp. SL250]|uniref:hypothetical protein n=1 Tax=Luteolibacter sp. SL250 TaxID=2995170 RepID=UPI002271D6AD|nr:hypothetical protein [Luteolibacter sp. SL250]WAC18771.1 hypothetical protein OVA24_16195 [Luteolibacter sp. SL250]
MKRLLILSCLLLPFFPHGAMAIPVEVIEARLRDVRFESFSVAEMTLPEALTALKKRVDEMTAENRPPEEAPLLLILVPPAPVAGDPGNHPPLTVSYDGKNVTLDTILREIARTANQDVFLTSAGVVITPKGMPPFPNPEWKEGEIFRKLTSDGRE